MINFLKELIVSHKFFFKESKSYAGYLKEDKSKSYPTFGYVTDYATKPFNPKNKVWGMDGIAYQKYYAYKFKDLLYFPIAYYRFMRLRVKDYFSHIT